MSIEYIKTIQDFERLTNGDKPVIIDFYADWCGPCKLISPKFEALAKEEKYGHIVFAKVNVDDVPEVSQVCSIRAMPTFQVYQNGAKTAEVVGANMAKILELVSSI